MNEKKGHYYWKILSKLKLIPVFLMFLLSLYGAGWHSKWRQVVLWFEWIQQIPPVGSHKSPFEMWWNLWKNGQHAFRKVNRELGVLLDWYLKDTLSRIWFLFFFLNSLLVNSYLFSLHVAVMRETCAMQVKRQNGSSDLAQSQLFLLVSLTFWWEVERCEIMKLLLSQTTRSTNGPPRA